MKFINKKNLFLCLNALVVTFAFGALCHLMLVTSMAIVKQRLSYLNPLDFLGISMLIPKYRDSLVVTGIGWLILVALFFIFLYIHIHYHVYVAVIREARWRSRLADKTKKISERLEKIFG